MPTYTYRCEEHSTFEQFKRMKDRAKGECPTCGSDSKKIVDAPLLLIEKMADAGCPGAFITSGDRMTKRHRQADHKASLENN